MAVVIMRPAIASGANHFDPGPGQGRADSKMSTKATHGREPGPAVRDTISSPVSLAATDTRVLDRRRSAQTDTGRRSINARLAGGVDFRPVPVWTVGFF